MITKVKILLSIWVVLVPRMAFGQTGPGGVGNATGTNGQPANALWLDAASLTGLSSGGKVSQWTDRSGNSRPASQATTANQPTYVTNVLNGQPVIRFDRGTSPQFLQITAAGTGNLVSGSRSVFLVAKANAGANASNRQGLFIAPLPNSGISFENSTNTRIVYEQFGAGGAYLQQKNNISGNTLGWYLINQMAFTSPTYTSIWNNLNGFANAGVGAAEPMRTYPDLVYLGRADSDWYLQGDMAEVIAYGTNVSNTQRIIVENYLSAKYAIAVANDFYTSHEAGYIRDVQGIGTVDGTDKHSLSSASQGLVLGELNSSLNAANEFVFAGHNAAANSLTASDGPASYNRWQRSWYVQKAGAVDARLTFDFGQAGLAVPANLAGDVSGYKLLYRSAATGAFGIVTGVTPTLQGSSGIGFDLTNAQLVNGYYTLAVPMTSVTCTWSASAATTNWNTASNWTEGIVPTSVSDVIVNACTICPQLQSPVTVNTLSLNNGSGLDLGSYTLTTAKANPASHWFASYATIASAGGKINSVGSTSVSDCVFNGDFNFETGINGGFEGNTYNGKCVFNFNAGAAGTVWFLGAWKGETYNDDVVFNVNNPLNLSDANSLNIGFGTNAQNVFKHKLTINLNAPNKVCTIGNIKCDSSLTINHNRTQTTVIFNQNAILSGSVNVNLNTWNDNITLFSPGANKQALFKKTVRINTLFDPAQAPGLDGNIGVQFSSNTSATGCVFDSTASIRVDSLVWGTLYFNRCRFVNRSSTLDISLPSRLSGFLFLSECELESATRLKASHLFLVRNNFAQELSVIRTGEGEDGYIGGNRFRKKLTFNNQGSSSSPVRLANPILGNDIIQSQ